MIEFMLINRKAILIIAAIIFGLIVMYCAWDTLYNTKEERDWKRYSKAMWKKRHADDNKKEKRVWVSRY